MALEEKSSSLPTAQFEHLALQLWLVVYIFVVAHIDASKECRKKIAAAYALNKNTDGKPTQEKVESLVQTLNDAGRQASVNPTDFSLKLWDLLRAIDYDTTVFGAKTFSGALGPIGGDKTPRLGRTKVAWVHGDARVGSAFPVRVPKKPGTPVRPHGVAGMARCGPTVPGTGRSCTRVPGAGTVPRCESPVGWGRSPGNTGEPIDQGKHQYSHHWSGTTLLKCEVPHYQW
eukprot:Gb_03015 [translate_table: standard]